MSVHIVIHERVIRGMLQGVNGPVARDIIARGRRVRELAKRLAPKRTGALASSIEMRIRIRASGISVLIGSSLGYARVAHDGRGPVRPRHATVLVFQGGAGNLVFAKSARSAAGQPFLRDALIAAL